MKFADIPGHEEIKARLRQMVDNERIPHALLLEGVSGSAKFALARAMAQYIHCTNRSASGDSCGQCQSCIQHQSFNHIDTFFSFPVVKKASKPTTSDYYVREFREFLSETPYMDFDEWLGKLGEPNAQPMIYVEEATELLSRLNLTARQSHYKVVLLWLPERLREEAANKLLKLIEEPFADTLFVMTSDNAKAILPTTYSRTQRIAVKRYDDTEVASFLQRELPIEPTEAERISQLADGSLSKALKLAGADKDSRKFLELFKQLMRSAWQRKVGELRRWSNDVAAMGRENNIRFYEYCSRLIRENFVMNIGSPTLVSVTADEMEFNARFSPFINERNIERLLKLFDTARADIAINGNSKIIAFDTAVQTILLLKA